MKTVTLQSKKTGNTSNAGTRSAAASAVAGKLQQVAVPTLARPSQAQVQTNAHAHSHGQPQGHMQGQPQGQMQGQMQSNKGGVVRGAEPEEVMSSLQQQLEQWSKLKTDMGALHSSFGSLGGEVQTYLSERDSGLLARAHHCRKPEFELLDADTASWCSAADMRSCYENAECEMVWKGTAKPDEIKQRRFHLEWSDCVLDRMGRLITVGSTWNAPKQVFNLAVARYVPSGKTLDPSFYSSNTQGTNNQRVGAVCSGIFGENESRGVQVLLSQDESRLFVLSTILDAESKETVANICALRLASSATNPSGSVEAGERVSLDASFGDAGNAGISVGGYTGAAAVRMAKTAADELFILLRLWRAETREISSMVLKFKPNGTMDTSFKPLNVRPPKTVPNTYAWIATDIAITERDILLTGQEMRLGSRENICDAFVQRYSRLDGSHQSTTMLYDVPKFASQLPGRSFGSGPRTIAHRIFPTRSGPARGGALVLGAVYTREGPREGQLITTERTKAFVASLAPTDLGIAPEPPATAPAQNHANANDNANTDAKDAKETTQKAEEVQKMDEAKSSSWVEFALSGRHKSTMPKGWAVDEARSRVYVVGFGLNTADEINSADGFMAIVNYGDTNQSTPAWRLPFSTSYYQAVTAVAFHKAESRLVATGVAQQAPTSFSRVASILVSKIPAHVD